VPVVEPVEVRRASGANQRTQALAATADKQRAYRCGIVSGMNEARRGLGYHVQTLVLALVAVLVLALVATGVDRAGLPGWVVFALGVGGIGPWLSTRLTGRRQ
jgi:hypothetical protein